MQKTQRSKLFPEDSQRLALAEKLQRSLAHALEQVSSGGVSPTIDLEAFRAELHAFDFSHERDLGQTIEWVIEALQGGMVHMTHPGCFGLFNPAPTLAAEFADHITAAFNPQVCVYSHAPVAVEIEQHVIAAVAKRLGFDADAAGHFTSGGSEANATAWLGALTSSNPAFAASGARAFSGTPTLYASRESHLAWLKIAHQTGIGREAVRLVPTDGQGRMDAAALAAMIVADKTAGHVPTMIVATAGTTNAGMVDPIKACERVAAEHNIWLHVDAAWGGAAIASEAARIQLAGIELADSVTIDAHKWFATTMGAGMYITRRQKSLADTFHVSADYMPSNDQSADPYVNSMQWSRRLVGLRLFLSLANAGWQGYAEHVEHSIKLIDNLCQQLKARGWTIANRSQMAVACLVPPTGHAAVPALVAKIVEQNQQWVSVAYFEQQPVLRVCATNGRSTQATIDTLINALVAAI